MAPLTSMEYYSNMIKEMAMDAFINSLPTNTTGTRRTIVMYNILDEKNICTTKQVEAAKAKGWKGNNIR